MSIPAQLLAILEGLDDEIFYAILDVALDIDNELVVSNDRTSVSASD